MKNQDISEKFINCLICKRKVNVLIMGEHDDLSRKNSTLPRPYPNEKKEIQKEYADAVLSTWWNDGGSGSIDIGYGSGLDGNQYYFVMCDKCINEKFNEGLLRFTLSSTYFDKKEKEINEANKRIDRFNNLNDILEN